MTVQQQRRRQRKRRSRRVPISTAGAGHVVDNISDSDKFQFISVTAKDGSVFFIVIDKQNVNDNVYFLNKVDISDLEALAKENSAAVPQQ